MKTAIEFLKENIEESNIPEEHYEWEIAEMMEDYATYYHEENLKLCEVVRQSEQLKDKNRPTFMFWMDYNSIRMVEHNRYMKENKIMSFQEVSQKYIDEMTNL